jgi:competence ComEA-like helix-hairpin-helix protein
MKLFDEASRRGLLTLAPLLLILLLLVLIAEVIKKPKLIDNPELEQVSLSEFNPNTYEYEELRASGVPSAVAAGIVRWRKYGKVYRIKEDLTQVTGMTDSLYAVLKPYIIIADSIAPQSKEYKKGSAFSTENQTTSERSGEHHSVDREIIENFTPEKFLIDTVSAAYLTRWGFSPKQAEVVVRYRDASGGIHSAEHFKRCYVVSEEMAEKIVPHIIFSKREEPKTKAEYPQPASESTEPKPLVDINRADSAALVAIDGIGPKSASEIIKYRKLLGGYHSVEQLSELKCITESNFEKILAKISCDSFVISKIDVNFASPKELERHPYVSAQTLRRIIKQRQLKGGWSRIEEMTEQNILSEEEAKRLAPYLRFGPRATE